MKSWNQVFVIVLFGQLGLGILMGVVYRLDKQLLPFDGQIPGSVVAFYSVLDSLVLMSLYGKVLREFRIKSGERGAVEDVKK